MKSLDSTDNDPARQTAPRDRGWRWLIIPWLTTASLIIASNLGMTAWIVQAVQQIAGVNIAHHQTAGAVLLTYFCGVVWCYEREKRESQNGFLNLVGALFSGIGVLLGQLLLAWAVVGLFAVFGALDWLRFE